MEEAGGGHPPASVQQGSNGDEELASQAGSSAMASAAAAATGQKRPRDGKQEGKSWKTYTKPVLKSDGTEHATYRGCLDCNKVIQQGCVSSASAPALYYTLFIYFI
jgi:hypothetical protein